MEHLGYTCSTWPCLKSGLQNPFLAFLGFHRFRFCQSCYKSYLQNQIRLKWQMAICQVSSHWDFSAVKFWVEFLGFDLSRVVRSFPVVEIPLYIVLYVHVHGYIFEDQTLEFYAMKMCSLGNSLPNYKADIITVQIHLLHQWMKLG